MATNTLGYYNPVFYAQEALIQLEKHLGMASRVYRGYDAERRAFRRGEYVNISRPATFTAQDAPDDGGQNTVTESVQVQLAYWREVKFVLTDKELAFTGERIIEDHIRPAAYALADDIDQKLMGLYVDVPNYKAVSSPTVAADIVDVRTIMQQRKVPVGDYENMHAVISPTIENELLDVAAFTQYTGSGTTGTNTQLTGELGRRYGFNFQCNQNAGVTHTGGVSADAAGLTDTTATYAAGTTTVHIDAVTDGGTAKAGDLIYFAGHTQTYVITADVTFTGGEGDVAISPGLESTLADGVVATFVPGTWYESLAFHRNAFALVSAPLSEMGNELGANIATIQDPLTGLSLRSRIYYVGNSSAVHVALDILYGVKTLDGNLAVRLRDA